MTGGDATAPQAKNSRRVVITGAGGFIGGHLVHELGELGTHGLLRGAFDDAAALRGALEGAETLVHAAGRAHILREDAAEPLRAFRAGNVETTRLAVRASLEAGVRRFILLSSVAVHGEGGGAAAWTGETPVMPVTPYGVSRAEAESVALAEAGDRLEVVILRLPMVYGPGMKGNPLRLFDLIQSGRPIPLGAVSNARSTLFVGNVAHAVRRFAEGPPVSSTRGSEMPPATTAAPTATYLVADEGTVSTPQFVREIAHHLGLPARLWRVPMPLLQFMARVGSAALGQRFPLTPDALARLAGSLVVDASPLARAVGAPPFSRAQGLRATAEWYLRTHR